MKETTTKNFGINIKNNVSIISLEQLKDAFEIISRELFLNRKYTYDINVVNTTLKNNTSVKFIPVSVNFATREYSLFQKFETNREEVYSNKENIKESIYRTNGKLTKYSPIMINSEFKIGDGQHRKIAQQESDIPVVFVMGADIVENDIKEINTHKALTLNDWLQHNIKTKTYSDLNNFMSVYGITNISVAQKMFLNTTNKDRFKMGEVRLSENIHKNVDKLDKIVALFKYIMINNELVDINKFQGKKNNFIKVVYDMFEMQNFNYNILLSKFKKSGIDLFGADKMETIRIKVLNVYNSGLQKENKIGE